MSAMLTMAVSVNMIPGIAFAEHQDKTHSAAASDAEAAQQIAVQSKNAGVVASGELEWDGELEFSSVLNQYQAVDSSNVVNLKNGTYEKWIDRINIPQYAVDFYNSMAEAADNDGDKDWLIDDAKGSVEITTIEGTAKSQEDALNCICGI